MNFRFGFISVLLVGNDEDDFGGTRGTDVGIVLCFSSCNYQAKIKSDVGACSLVVH